MERSFTIMPTISYMDDVCADAIVIWLDDSIGTSVENQWFNIVGRLRRSIGHAKVFTTIKECIEYIQATSIKLILFIVTGTYGDNFDVRLFKEIIDDVFIYVLASDKLFYNVNHPTIRGYFDSVNILIDQVHDDYMTYATTTMFDTNFTRQNMKVCTSRCLNPQLIKWKCIQLMFDILRRMPCPREESRHRFIQYCKSQYQDSPVALETIGQFVMTYCPGEAINWYLRDCFLYRLVNKSCRTDNIDVIMDFSFLTVDIYDQLYACHYQQNTQKSSCLVVYRGQIMSIDEVQQLKCNVGGFISNNSILSATQSSEVAMVYAGPPDIGHYAGVFIEICINSNSYSLKPFANISLSHFSNEDEVLFMSGSIFHIDSCELINENLWKIQLILCDNSYPIVQNSTDYFDIAIMQLLEILPKISPMTNKANDQMLQQWRLYCNNDRNELRKIDQFEESYRSDSSIRWYTKNSLLFHLLNTALRHGNIDMIVDLRYFIVDLHGQLTKSHLDYVRHFKNERLTVYRGQKMSLFELRRFKHTIGECISIKQFFSASLSSIVARIYAELSESDRKQFLQSVLFEINIDMSWLEQFSKDHPFANIMNLSNFVDEDEILFMANTRFRIQSVKKWSPTLWVISLTLLSLDDENEEEMKVMNQCLKYLTNMFIERSEDIIWALFKNNCDKQT